MTAKGDTFDLLYCGGTLIGLCEWEGIIHALITYGQHVWIPGTVSVAQNLPERLRAHIWETLQALMVQKIVSCWRFEGTPVAPNLPVHTNFTKEVQGELYARVNEHLVTSPSAGRLALHESSPGVEKTSKVIDYRHELWNLGIAAELGASGVLLAGRDVRGDGSSPFYRYELLNRRYCHRLFEGMRLPSLASLDVEDVAELRRRSKGLRQVVDKMLTNKLLELPPTEEVVSRECEDAMRAYSEMVARLAKGKSGKALGLDATKDAFLTSLGLLHPIIGLVAGAYPAIERTAMWLTKRKQYAFLLYAVELERRGQ